MACLRGSSVEGCFGTLLCDEEGCEFRLIEDKSFAGADVYTPQADCVLQFRLRAGGSPNAVRRDLGLPIYPGRTGLLNELEQASKTPTISERSDGHPGPKTWAKLVDECEHFVVATWEQCLKCRAHVDTAIGYEYDINQNVYRRESYFRGPEVNTIYIDEYQNWLKAANPALGEIVDFDSSSFKPLVEARLQYVSFDFIDDPLRAIQIIDESHIVRGEN